MFVFKWIIRFCFKLSGWKVVGEIPKGVKKAVLVGGPHTSSWDLFYTLGLMYTLDLKFRFLIKQEALVFPVKNILLSLGAFPIQREGSKVSYVDQIAKVFAESEECFLCIAPEGTRKPVSKWKTGFYHIARKANVPVVVGYPDCLNKVVHVGVLLDTSGSEHEVMAELKEQFKKSVPKKPENFITQ